MAVTTFPNGVAHSAAGDATETRAFIGKLIWAGSSTAGDDLVVKDGRGNVILELKSNGLQHQAVEYPFGRGIVPGFETDVLDAGEVGYIYD